MAKIKWGMIVTDGRGKLGGQVFSKNNAGAYIRTKVTPSNPRTAAQTAARALFGLISSQWSDLSDSVRAGFNGAVADWARTDIFGDLKNPTGKNLFQRLNNQAQAAGWPAVATLPPKQGLPTDIVTSAEFSVAGNTLTLTGAPNSAQVRIMLFATGQLPQGVKFVKNRLRQIDAFLASSAAPGDQDQAYKDKFGSPALNDNIYIGVKYVMDSGQASPMQTIKASIVA